MSVLFCDTNCEVWYTEAKELGLDHVIRMPYTLDGKEYYYDLGEKTDFRHFYDRLRAKADAKTSALNKADYIEYFEPVFAAGEDILYLSFSSKLSGTFEFMDQAVAELKEKYPGRKFTRFDTKSISVGAGISVYYAAKMKQEGRSDEEILAFLKTFITEIGCYFAVDDLNHLKRGGRLSPTTAAFGTLLGIKPILTVNEEGALLPLSKVRGRRSAINALFEFYRERVAHDGMDVWIVGADCEEDLDKLCEMVKGFTPDRRIHRQIVGPVIASHCGPDTLGIIFHSKKN